MVTQLLQHEGIKTTAVKARAIRPLVDQAVTLAKRGVESPHAARQLQQLLRHESTARRVLAVLPQRYASRPGGYTTRIRLPPRRGDGASMVYLMMVDGPVHELWKDVAKDAPPPHLAGDNAPTDLKQ